jgi:HlyD family secretion protein
MEMSASVEILVAKHEQVLTIPAQAVLVRRLRDLPRTLRTQAEKETCEEIGSRDPARAYHEVVFVEVGGKSVCRLVKTGVSERGRVAVIEGLREGERVVVGPYRSFEKLKDGKPIAELNEKDEDIDVHP